MSIDLVKAIKSTHRDPINRILHLIGLPIYVIGIILVIGYFLGLHTQPITGITLWSMAICFFMTGHKIEGNLRAITLIVLFKYLKSRKAILSHSHWVTSLTSKKLLTNRLSRY